MAGLTDIEEIRKRWDNLERISIGKDGLHAGRVTFYFNDGEFFTLRELDIAPSLPAGGLVGLLRGSLHENRFSNMDLIREGDRLVLCDQQVSVSGRLDTSEQIAPPFQPEGELDS